MQVASSHRPHPPPVPPRPSRQVVAEALKRGNPAPRPPCPTRQAPPPPNTKPWRPPPIAAGRTVIYESKSTQSKDNSHIKIQEYQLKSEKIEYHRQKPPIASPPPPIEIISNGNEKSPYQDRKDIVITTSRVQGPLKGLELDKKSQDNNCNNTTVVVIEETDRKILINEDNKDNIEHKDWLEAGVRYSSTKITLSGDDSINGSDKCTEDEEEEEEVEDEAAKFDLDFSSIRERIAMSSLQGLPPLPRSLSGFNLSEGRRDSEPPPPPPPARSSSKSAKGVKTPQGSRPSPPSRQLTTLDTQLAILRKEMFGLRQLDLSLLSQLWSLNESIQEFRQLLQDQEDRVPSSSPSSEDGDEGGTYHGHPPPPPRRPAPLLHHHRPPRPPRPLRPPPSDESPSSEEYGAV